MAMPIFHSDLYPERPTEAQLRQLISQFRTEPTFVCLAMWCLMFSLHEGTPKYKQLQQFFIDNILRPELRGRVIKMAALDSDEPRPVFGRWQLLSLMKLVLLHAGDAGFRDPTQDQAAQWALGDACLMVNDLIFTEEQTERLNAIEGDDKREKVHDELMTQWFPQLELLRVPDVYQAIARNDEYFSIFEGRVSEFQFANGQSLSQRFVQLTGLELPRYLQMYFVIYVVVTELQKKDLSEIASAPSVIHFDRDVVFGNYFSSQEKSAFFDRVIAGLHSLTKGVEEDANRPCAWQFDFTTFRDYPLFSIFDSRQVFSCMALPFVIEKLASGIYHTILNSWVKGHPERQKFQSYWGKVFEAFVNDRLGEEYPTSLLAKRLYTNPHFVKKKLRGTEVSDALLDCGTSVVLMEHKGGYLNVEEKYGDNPAKLLAGVAEKCGLDKAIKQLTRSIGILFSNDANGRDTFCELDENQHPVNVFEKKSLDDIRTVYPVLVVQDFSMASGFVNRRLKLQFIDKVAQLTLREGLDVRPLSVLTIENLENVLEHVGEIPLTVFLDQYAREYEPLDDFNAIFNQYLKEKGLDEKRRYKWSVGRCERILTAIGDSFMAL